MFAAREQHAWKKEVRARSLMGRQSPKRGPEEGRLGRHMGPDPEGLAFH